MDHESHDSFVQSELPMNGIDSEYRPGQMKTYPFVKGVIPRLRADDPEVDRLISAKVPVVVTGSELVQSAKDWNLEYLEQNLGKGKNFVYKSTNQKFMYYDEKRMPQWPGFQRPTERYEMEFSEFVERLVKAGNSGERLYLQQTLNDTVGPNIVKDFVRFRWDWVTKYQRMCHWGPLTSNLLLVGMEGNVTPGHYDEQDNFFAQILGLKRCTLFSPDQFESLYPYPVSHPCDRQSQVDFDNPDYAKFPKFEYAKAIEGIVGPGDVLYIPMYWWHNIESVPSLETLVPRAVPATISVNFWYKASGVPPKIERPLRADHKIAVMRNIEKLLNDVMGDPREIGQLLRTIVDGRYEDDLFFQNKISET